MEASRAPLIMLVLVAILALATHSSVLRNDFVWDDHVILKDPMIRSLGNIPAIFARGLWSRSDAPKEVEYYRPLQTVSFVIDHAIWGMRPVGYHLTNLLLHAAGAVLFFLLAIRMGLGRMASLGAAAVFAVHPVRTETVAFISDRNDLLMAVGLLAALLAVPGPRRKRGSWFANLAASLLPAMVCFNFALYAKETALAFMPLVVVAPLVWAPDRWRDPNARRHCLGLAIVLALSIVPYWLARSAALRGLPGGQIVLDPNLYWTPALVVKYFAAFFLPYPLNVSHLLVQGEFPLSVMQALAAAGGLLLIARSLRCSHGRHQALFGIAWFMLTIMPVCHLFRADLNFSERYLYLPSTGLILASAWGLRNLFDGFGRRRRTVGTVLILVLVALMAAASFQRDLVWRDNRSLWSDTYGKSPLSFVVAQNMGVIYSTDMDAAGALAFLDGFIKRLDSAGAKAEEAADFRSLEAREEISSAITVYRSYISLLHLANRQKEAGRFVDRLKKLDPYSLETAFFSGLQSLSRGSWVEAAESFSVCLAGNPLDLEARHNRALALEMMGSTEEAREDYVYLLLRNPKDPKATSAMERLDRKATPRR